jgi:hypothetical protein
MEGEKEIRLSVDELELVFKKAKLVTSKEAVYRVWIEPGELVIKVVQ